MTATSESGAGTSAHDTDPNAANRVADADRGPGMDHPVHYTYATADAKPSGRDTRVCEAVRLRDYVRVEKLVTDGCDVHQRAEQDWTPLNIAAGMGDAKMVELLLRLGADVRVTGRDRRTPRMIAHAANRTEIVRLLATKERERGIEEPEPSERCVAFPLGTLRRFQGWREKRDEWTINDYWSSEVKAEFEKPFEAEDVVFLHQDFTVTRSMWRGEHVVFDDVSAEWKAFCRETLGFGGGG